MQEETRGHQSPITWVDVHGETVCTGGYDGRVILWKDRETVAWSFLAPDLINQVAFDSAGQRVAAPCADGYIYILETATGMLLSRLGPHGDDANAVAWGRDDARLAAVMDAKDKDIHVWDVGSKTEVAVLPGHEHGVFAICFDPAGERMATAAEDGTARVWTADGEVLHVLRHPGDPEAIDWSPCGRYIATGCDDGILRIWDPDTGAVITTSDAASGAVRFVRFARDRPELMAGSYDGALRIHRLGDFAHVRTFQAFMQWERSAAFLPEGVVIGSFGARPVYHVSDTPTDPGRTYGINALAATSPQAGAPALVAGRDDGTVVDVLAQRVLYTHPSIVNGVAFSPDGRLVVSGDYQGGIALYDRQEDRVVARRTLGTGPINTAVWLADADRFATAGYDGCIRWWSPALELVHEVEAHGGPIKSLAWNPVTGTLIAGSSDDSISGWHGYEKRFHIRMDGLVLVNSVAAAPTEPHFASASRDLTVRVWHAETGALLHELPVAHVKSVKAIAYAPDGKHILTGAYDARGVLWTHEHGQWQGRVLERHRKPGVPAVAFLGTTPVTAGWDARIYRWSLDGQLAGSYDIHEVGAI